MNEEQKLVYLRAQILCAEIELQGMIAENQYRAHLGHVPAYINTNFRDLFIKYPITHNCVISEIFPN